MSLTQKWVPMRWRCGPSEAARQVKGISAEDLSAVSRLWADPASLGVLAGTPVNCLVVDWAAGTTADTEQQKTLEPLIAEGHRSGLSLVGKIGAKANVAAAADAAHAAGLDAVMLEGQAQTPLPLPAIAGFARDAMEWDRTTSIFSTTGNMWPGVNLDTMRGDTALGGPTGDPWVDSNGWFALLARRMAAGKSLWLEIALPAASEMLPAAQYCLAVADSWMYGSRWIIDLDAHLRRGLTGKQESALHTWAHIARTISYFEAHSAWEACQPMGVLAVVSDYSGANGYMGGEVLNLLNRRQVQFVVLDRRDAFAGPVEGVKAVLWVDGQAPDPTQHRHLLSFTEQGGLVIAGSYWGPTGVEAHREDWLFNYDIYSMGKGRMVVAAGGFSDPYQLARDAHLLVGRENDLARLYNPGTTNCFASLSPEGGREVVQIVNYATPRAASYVALWISANVGTARLWSPEGRSAHELTGKSASPGTTFDLPAVSVHCAVEIERLA